MRRPLSRPRSDGVRVAHEREAAGAGQLKSAETGPQQVAAQNARAKRQRPKCSRLRRSSIRPNST